jgi:TM2 domain-containing membrane protein YozV
MEEVKKKTRVNAILLCIFLGAFGGHLFYLGNQKRATWYLVGGVLGVLSCFAIPTYFVSWIFAIIDLVNLAKLSDEDFDAQYNSGVQPE